MGSAVIFAGTKVKTLKSTIDLNGGNDVISSTTDPTSVAVSANIGSLLLNSSNGKVYKKNDNGSTTNWTEVGASGQAGINYISNPNAETNTSDWLVYREENAVTFQDTGDTVTLVGHNLTLWDPVSFTSIVSTTGISVNTTYYVRNISGNTFQLASSVGGASLPLTTNGSGTMVRGYPRTAATAGSPTVTWALNTSTPLRGKSDFRLVKDANNRMGEGVSIPFTLNNADLAKVITITFDYELISGTYANGDIKVYLIKDPTGTPVLIEPVGTSILTATASTKMKHIAQFQTDSSGTSYRFVLHITTPSTSAYTIDFDSFVVGPQVVQYGAPVTDWVDKGAITFTGTTANPTKGTTSLDKTWVRRVGGDAEFRFEYNQTVAGTAGTGMYLINLPSGYSIDTTKLDANTTVGDVVAGNKSCIGVGALAASGVTTGLLNFHVYDATRIYAVILPDGSTAAATWGAGLAPLSTTSLSFAGSISVPILGWSSTVEMSNDTDTRVVAFRGYATTNTTLGTSGTEGVISIATVQKDTHGAFASNQYVVPVAGWYEAKGQIVWTPNSTGARQAIIRKNGSIRQSAGVKIAEELSNTVNNYSYVSSLDYYEAGDYIELVGLQTSGGSLATDIPGTNREASQFFSVYRLSGPSAIACSETVSCRYRSTAAQTIPNNVTTVYIDWPTKDYDTHGMYQAGSGYNSGTGNWTSAPRWIVPIAGKYLISVYGELTGLTANTGSTFILLAKNLSGEQYMHLASIGASTEEGLQGTATVALEAGDSIAVRFFHNNGASRSLTAAASENWITIHRIGN